jgi:hypothetical protein
VAVLAHLLPFEAAVGAAQIAVLHLLRFGDLA